MQIQVHMNFHIIFLWLFLKDGAKFKQALWNVILNKKLHMDVGSKVVGKSCKVVRRAVKIIFFLNNFGKD